jgi:hypothetical protein
VILTEYFLCPGQPDTYSIMEAYEALAKLLKPGLPRFARNDQLLRMIVIARRNDEAISSRGDFCKRLI